MGKRQREEQERQMQLRRSQLRSDIAVQVQALHGGSSSSVPQAGMSGSPRGSSSQMTPQTSGLVPEQTDMMTFLDQFLNFEPTENAPMAPGVQPGPRAMQPVANQRHNQDPSRQLQATDFADCNPTSVAKPGIQPYSQQNHIGRRNASRIGTQQTQLMSLNQQILRAEQADGRKMQVSQPGVLDNRQSAALKSCKPEPMTPPLQHHTGAHRSSLLRENPRTPASMESAREVDLIEKMFRQIKSWNEAYFSKFMELDRGIVVPKLTEEQLSSLPKDIAKNYISTVNAKKATRKVLNFLQLQKSNLHEGLKSEFPMVEKLIRHLMGVIESKISRNAKINTGSQLQNCGEQSQVGNAAPATGGKSASILQSRRITVAGTPPAHQQDNSNHFLGVASSSCSISASGTLQSSPTNKLECLTPSPVAKSGATPSASPCALVKPIFTSPVAKPVVAPAALPCDPVVSVPMDCDSIIAFLSHDNAAIPAQDPNANGSNQATPKATASASPLQTETVAGTAEDQVRSGSETAVGNRPINRLIEAIRSSSPAALRKSANSIWSVLSIDDIVPPGKISTILDCKVSQQQHGGFNAVDKMKRIFDHTEIHSESLPFGRLDFSSITHGGSSSERNMKRHKTQNANDALLEEIISVNNVMIDTVISVTGDCGTARITSCGDGTVIKLSYSAVSLAPTLKALLATSEMSLVMPAKLFVPADYPSSSPVPIEDEGDDQLRNKFSDISVSVHMAFRRALCGLPEPRSIKETARAWDACVRKAVVEFAEQHGGGTVSSVIGQWERCAATSEMENV